MIFGRNRTARHEQVVLPEQLKDERDLRVDAETALAPSTPETRGPHDVRARPDAAGYIDLGALRIRAVKGMALRLDLEDATQRIVAVTVTVGRSALQIQAFSAPRAGGLWDELRAELVEGLAETPGAHVQEQQGGFGPEVLTRIPAAMPDGSPGWNVARFVGVDGPRWFVRGVFHGEAAFQPDEAAPLERVFGDTVVVRGDGPLPPRDLLPLRTPDNARPVQRRRSSGDAPADGGAPPEGGAPAGEVLPTRGPEITEIR